MNSIILLFAKNFIVACLLDLSAFSFVRVYAAYPPLFTTSLSSVKLFLGS